MSPLSGSSRRSVGKRTGSDDNQPYPVSGKAEGSAHGVSRRRYGSLARAKRQRRNTPSGTSSFVIA
jgi:hypothetical protein